MNVSQLFTHKFSVGYCKSFEMLYLNMQIGYYPLKYALINVKATLAISPHCYANLLLYNSVQAAPF